MSWTHAKIDSGHWLNLQHVARIFVQEDHPGTTHHVHTVRATLAGGDTVILRTYAVGEHQAACEFVQTIYDNAWRNR